ncbi:TPA: hypothetical protein I7721_17695 [Vibrio vulnificus]|nr:hypothetical protein [Vibrio vulnificus]
MSELTSKSYKLSKTVIEEIAEISKTLNIPQSKIIEDAITHYSGHMIKNITKQDEDIAFRIDNDFNPECSPEHLMEIKEMEINDFIILKLKFINYNCSYYCALKVCDVNDFGGIAEFKGIRPSEASKTFNNFREFSGRKIAFRFLDVCDKITPQDIELHGGEEKLYYQN